MTSGLETERTYSGFGTS